MRFIKFIFCAQLLLLCFSISAQNQCLPSSPDTDNDGICNLLDQCPGLDDQLIGTPCNDGDACTTNDQWVSSCDCEGTLLSDSDNDGVCDALDLCANFDDDIDIDEDGIPYCQDACVDANLNGICDDVDTAPFTNKLKIHFSLKRGFYDNTIQVELISSRPNTNIRYTLGDDPSCPSAINGTIYTGPITISNQSELSTLKAIGTNNGQSTKVYTHSYIFNGFDLPSVVFSCSPYEEASGESEDPISFEFIVPSSSPLKSIQEYAGTRTSSGGVSAGSSDKVYFRSEYGAGTLKEDLFSDRYYGPKPVEKIDQLFLRSDHLDDTMLKQIMGHDALRATGEYSPAGRFVYFYVDGGLEEVRHLQERPEGGFMEAQTGIEKQLWDAFSGDQSSGLASRVDSGWDQAKKVINVESFGTFLVNQWIVNASDYWSNRNYRTAGPANLNSADGEDFAWHYFNWDLDLGYRDGSTTGWRTGNFGSPEGILSRMRNHVEFDLRFADIIHCSLEEDGALTPAPYNERILARGQELNTFLANDNSYNINNTGFLSDMVNDYIPGRVSWLRSELREDNYYPNINAVTYSIAEGTIPAGQQLTLNNPNNAGNIYYTLDGTDVRTEAGALRQSAILYTGPITLTAGVKEVFARVYRPNAGSMIDRWSATCGAKTYYVAQNYTNIVINEIHYAPLDGVSGGVATAGNNFEFIEVKNIGSTPVNLKGASFTDGVEMTIENSLIVPPNGFAVFAENAEVFQATYGFAADGQYSGKLDNNGENIEMVNPLGYQIDVVEYDQNDPWDEAADSTGYTLELLHGTFDNQDPLSWFRSDNVGGTPGAENSRTCAVAGAGIVINEINYNSNELQLDPGDWVELHNPTSSAVDLSGWSLYDSGAEFVLPQGTILGAEGYLVLVAKANDFATAFPTINNSLVIGELGFGLSSKGERITLFDSNKCLADYVIYNDKAPWPVAPDGDGPSLSLLDPALDNSLPASWESSIIMNESFVNGSPSVSNICVPGQPCNDGDECTSNDTFDADCNCAGTLETADSDNDGVCDIADICPNFNDSLIGTPCDDGDDCTAGETYDADCGCSGGISGDIDNDGLCDALDPCDNNITGTSCEDGDPCTIGETYDIDCNCTGGVPNDADEDGVCDEQDLCIGFDDNLLGQICDDGNPMTEFDMYNAATCGCSGIITSAEVCTKIANGDDDAEELSSGSVTLVSSDMDMKDGYIVALRFQNIDIPNGATITNAAIQFGADETDTAETNITINAEATDDAAPFTTASGSIRSKVKSTATVVWTPEPWTSTGVQTDAQKTIDLSPILQEIINRPGFVAGNSISFIIEGIGTRVAESYNTSPTLAAELCVSYNTGVCQIGYPCDDANEFTGNDVLQADCSCAGTIIDADGDGVPVTEDCNDNDANLTTPGATCNDGDITTENDIVLENCVCAGTQIIVEGLNITGINYKPLVDPALNDDNFEFLFVTNYGMTDLDVSGDSIKGIGFVFPAETTLTAGETVMLTKSLTIYPDFDYRRFELPLTSKLSNGGEELLVKKVDNEVIDEVTYDDVDPWPTEPDGNGSYLQLIAPDLDNTLAENWIAVPLPPVFGGCTDNGGDLDGDGVCGDLDCNDLDAAISFPGNACDDGDATTENDVIGFDCACAGTPIINEALNITGINYKPLVEAPLDDDNFEFLLVTNYGETPVSVASDSIKGIGFVFAADEVIQPGETVMLVKSMDIYPELTDFRRVIWEGSKLSNGGERLLFKKPNNGVVNDLTYDDVAPWPVEADGQGYYLSLIAPNLDNTVAENWEAILLPAPLAPDPCVELGGDSDGDGVCDFNDCGPNNPDIPAIPGTACNDFNVETTNDVILADGCTCEGIIVVEFDCPLTEQNYGDLCNDDDPTTENDSIQDDCSCAGTPIVIYECPIIEANYGEACNDDDPTTENDSIQDDCSCAGTPIQTGGCATYTIDGLTISVQNLTAPIATFKLLDIDFNALFDCNDFGVACNTNEVYTVPGPGTYWVQIQAYETWDTPICDIFEAVTFSGTTPCANNGGDSDGDGICDDVDDCDGNLAGTSCDDGDADTENDVLDGDCNCAGTPIQTGGGCATYTIDGLTISVQNLTAPIATFKLLDVDFNPLFDCNDFGVACNANEVYTVPAPGTYWIQIQAYETWDTPICNIFEAVTFSGASACANNGGDSDGDGICDDVDDCDGNLAGTSCDDGDADTENDVLDSDCNCAGTPIQTGGDCGTYSVDGFTISGQNLNAPIVAFKVLDAGYNTLFECNDFGTACNATEAFTVPAPGTYWIQIQAFQDWSTPICNVFEAVTVSGGIGFAAVQSETAEQSTLRRAETTETFGIFPNPAKDVANVSLQGYEGKNIEIQLVDQMGNRIQMIRIDNVMDTNYTIDLNDVKTGFYSLWILTDDKRAVGKKLMVNKMR